MAGYAFGSNPPYGLALCRKPLHLGIEIGFALKADARQIRHRDDAVLDANAVGETAIGLEQIGIALIAAEPETGRDVQRHLMPAMRDAARRRPAMGLQHRQSALIFAEPVGQGAVELQKVAVGPHAAVSNEIARILMAEQVLAGRHGTWIEFCERRLKGKVERTTGFLVAEQRIAAQPPGLGNRGLAVEPAVSADRDRALAMAARLFVCHQGRPDLVRIEIVAGLV